VVVGEFIVGLQVLIELVRESVVEGWLSRDIAQPGFPQDINEYAAKLNDFFRDEFLTSSAVESFGRSGPGRSSVVLAVDNEPI
jgi:hypothetical protein